MLSDTVLDLAVAFDDLALIRRGASVCGDCFSLALAKRLIQIVPLLEGVKIEARELEYLTAASTMAVDDVVRADCADERE
jgi:hypothetical protein